MGFRWVRFLLSLMVWDLSLDGFYQSFGSFRRDLFHGGVFAHSFVLCSDLCLHCDKIFYCITKQSRGDETLS